ASVERIKRMRPSRGLSLRVLGKETEKTVAVAALAGQVAPKMARAARIERMTARFRAGMRFPWSDNLGKTTDCIGNDAARRCPAGYFCISWTALTNSSLPTKCLKESSFRGSGSVSPAIMLALYL